MVKRTILTASLLAVGLFTSLGYSALAQQSQGGNQPNVGNPTGNQTGTQQPNLNNQTGTQQTIPGSQTGVQQPNLGNQTGAQQRTQTRLSEADRQFVIKAAQSGMGEIMLGQLAAQRGTTQQVKDYGRQLVEHHRQANQQLQQLAAQKGITLPTDTDAKHKALRARLGQIPGIRFDRTFVREMQNDHNVAIALFRQQAQGGQDQDLKTFASNTLPLLQNHRQMAIALNDNLASR